MIDSMEELTGKRIRMGAGTLYGTLSKMEKDGLIRVVEEQDRRKFYRATETGRELLEAEIARLKELYENGVRYGGNYHE
jgi:DNA-binding PadR family transcriptional regulator